MEWHPGGGIGLTVWAGTRLGRYLMDATPTPDGDTVANRMLGHSPGDYAAGQEGLAERRRLAGPFSPKLYPLDTVLGGGFGLILVAAATLVFRETTRGAGRPTRVALAVLAAALLALRRPAAASVPEQLASLRRRLGWLLVDQGPVGEQLETAGRGRRSGELVLLALQAS